MSNPQETRQAIVAALPLTSSNYGEEPERRLVYVPPAHTKALRLESNLVVGARGVGKSFWTAALSSEVLRKLLGQTVHELERTNVRIGFAVNSAIDAYPDGDVFGQMIRADMSAYDIWRGVVARWLAETIGAYREPIGQIRSLGPAPTRSSSRVWRKMLTSIFLLDSATG
jgi:hypothetical protein